LLESESATAVFLRDLLFVVTGRGIKAYPGGIAGCAIVKLTDACELDEDAGVVVSEVTFCFLLRVDRLILPRLLHGLHTSPFFAQPVPPQAEHFVEFRFFDLEGIVTIAEYSCR
jgi:hypothetical protein